MAFLEVLYLTMLCQGLCFFFLPPPFFLNITGPWHIYLDFRFCVYRIFLSAHICVSMHLYVIFLFSLGLFIFSLFVCCKLFWFACFYVIIIIITIIVVVVILSLPQPLLVAHSSFSKDESPGDWSPLILSFNCYLVSLF